MKHWIQFKNVFFFNYIYLFCVCKDSQESKSNRFTSFVVLDNFSKKVFVIKEEKTQQQKRWILLRRRQTKGKSGGGGTVAGVCFLWLTHIFSPRTHLHPYPQNICQTGNIFIPRKYPTSLKSFFVNVPFLNTFLEHFCYTAPLKQFHLQDTGYYI